MSIQWFRVAEVKLVSIGPPPSFVVCGACLIANRLVVLNRVFGASQTCAKCGKTDKREEDRS